VEKDKSADGGKYMLASDSRGEIKYHLNRPRLISGEAWTPRKGEGEGRRNSGPLAKIVKIV